MKSTVRHPSNRGFVRPPKDRYRTPHPTEMPVLRDQQHKQIFQTALTQLVRRQDLVDWNLLHTTLCDTTELETQAVQQRGAIDAVTRMMEDAITAYATYLQDQQHFAQLETQRRGSSRRVHCDGGGEHPPPTTACRPGHLPQYAHWAAGGW